MFAASLQKRICLFIVLGMTLQVGLLACSGSSSEESREPSISPEAADHLGRAQQLLRNGALRSALAHADTAAAIDSSAADVFFLRGRIFTQLTWYDKAESAYKRALSLNPERQGAWFNIGNNYFRRGSFRKALKRYKREAERYPTPSLYLHIGQAYSGLGKADSALYAHRKALAIDSSFAPAHAWLGQMYNEEGEYEKALDYTKRALELDSANLKYRYFMGNLLLRTGNPGEAVEHLERVVREQPWHSAAHYTLGQSFARLNRQEPAEKHLARADTLQKQQAEIERLQALAQEYANEPRRWIDLAGAMQEMGRLKKAKEAYSVALSLAPQSVGIRNNIANIALALGDTTEAIDRYKAIIETDSTRVEVWINLGVAYAKTGRTELAINTWKRALRYNPDHPRVKAYLAKLTNRDG